MNNEIPKSNSFLNFVRLSPLHQFWINIIIPFCGLIFFHWTPGNVLFCFGIEMVNYWLCNVVLLVFYVTNESIENKLKHALRFSLYSITTIVGFFIFVHVMCDNKNPSMTIKMDVREIIVIILLYWVQFTYYLYAAQPKGKVTTFEITNDVMIRLTGIYLTVFCLVGYLFVFWSNTNIMNYALTFSLVFAKSLADLVMVARKVINEKKLK